MISSSDIISRSFTVYKENFVDYLKYIALNFLPELVSFAIFSIFGVTATIIMGANNLNGVVSLSLGIFLVVASTILIAALAFWIKIAFMRMVGLKDRGDDTEGVLSNFMSVRTRFWRAIGTFIMVGLYAGWPIIVTTVLYSLLTTAGITNSAISLLFGLLGIAAVVYAFYYSIRLIFSVFHVVLDDGEIMESINFSMEQVDGRWWGVFWRLIAPAVVFFLIVFISQLALSVIILAIVDVTFIGIIIFLLTFLIEGLVSPLYLTAQLALYNDVAGKGGSSAQKETKPEESMESETEKMQSETEETQSADQSESSEDQNENKDFTETTNQEESES